MRFSEAKEYIINRLVKELPKNLAYHGVHHTLDVVKQAQTIGKSEEISNDEMFILLTAAYFHDAGFLFQYHSNEPEAAKLASEILPKMEYTKEEIDVICKIILATNIEVQPRTLLEKIMCDADHDYFGRQEYSEIAFTLRKEHLEYGTSYLDIEWIKVQIKFLEEKHQYYTNTSSKLKQKMKEENIKVLKKQLATF